MTIKNLVDEYQKSRTTFIKSNYNETQLRKDFLDPLFQLLGWDIGNEQGKPTNEREVLLEEGLRGDAGTNTKKPDYTFRLYSERKFFLEAKKPSVNIESDNNPAKQVRRYGFTAKLRISVLSNFEYLAIYDCSNEVKEEDSVDNSRVSLYHFTEYEALFEEIKEKLSHDAVYSGKFDETWKDIEEQLKLSSVDNLFLEQVNEWRISLGKQLYSLNSDIDESELNDSVQRYLNSIIFLRVCEDRNLERYKTLLNFADKNDFNALIAQFEKSDRKYNAGLFNDPSTQEVISNGNSAFWDIIKKLYFPESTYSFAVFSSDILGNIYEVFLSEQLVIENGNIYLRKKPENVDRDIVTTPIYIIRDILRQTVVKFCHKKTDKEILESTFADIACGSGAFLLEIFQVLQDILTDYYIEHEQEKLIHTSVDTYKLPFETKKKILESCIFGVDKDFNAVRACKFGLLLKLLEDEENNTITEPALPNIDNNICYGNSLINSEQVSDNNFIEINPCNFGDKKFDVIVGNPPYMATEHMKQFTPQELPLYKKHYFSAYKQFDKYFLFIERGMQLLNEGGNFGYIVPSKFAKVGAGKKLRELLSDGQMVKEIISFGANQVFHDKTTYTCLLILGNEKKGSFQYSEVNNLKDWKIRNIGGNSVSSIKVEELDNDVWVLVPMNLKPLYDTINSQSESLENIVGSDGIYNGIQTSANRIYIHTATAEDDDFVYFSKDGKDWKFEKTITRPYFKTAGGIENLDTYRSFSPNSFVIYPYLKTENGIEFVELEKLEKDFPNAFEYLNSYKDDLNKDGRDIKPTPDTPDEWYRYGRHQSLEKCDVPEKIIVGVLSQGNKYGIDFHSTFISSGGTAGYCMITLPKDCKYSVYYIQAILNSKYLEWFAALNGEIFRGGYIARGTKVLKRLPIRVVNFEDANDKDLHDRISQLQKQLIQIQGKIDVCNSDRKRVPLQTQFNQNKTELTQLLKSLYNLGTSDELVPLISELYAPN